MKNNIELISELVKLRSVTADVSAVNRAQEIMKAHLESAGVTCVMNDFNGRKVLYASTLPGKTQDILLNAHLDVVPAIEESQYEVTEKDGLLYGRGVSDCLGNAAVIADVLIRLNGKASIGAIFSADEETGSECTENAVNAGYGARKVVLMLDGPGDNIIAYAQKGIISLKLTAHGHGGHSAEPWQHKNPIDKLIDGYTRLRDSWTNPTEKEQWSDSLAVCIVNAGSAHNQIPDTAEMVLNIRYIKDEDKSAIIERVKNITGAEVEIIHTCAPVAVDMDAPAIRTLGRAMEKVVPSKKVSYMRMNGATDARYFKVLDVPIAIIGTDGGGGHSICEFLKPESLNTLSDILCEFAGMMR